MLNVSGTLYPAAGQVYHNVTFDNVLANPTISTGGSANNNVKFNRVEFKSNGTINGYNTFNELVFSPGKTYTLQSTASVSYIQTITGTLNMESSCLGWAILKSSTVGSPATISMPSTASPNVSGVMMANIKAIGGATFVAKNSIDNGGNTGWTFTYGATPDLYWVGGAGDWNDAKHWSFKSGGVGGDCIPSPTTNVFFNGASGFTANSFNVIIEGIAYCRNITFSGAAIAPSLGSVPGNISNTLNIYGSSVWQQGMSMTIYTVNYQNTGTAKTITSNGVKTAQNSVYLYETTSVSLVDDFAVGNSFYVNAGTFNTNNKRLTTSWTFNAIIGTAPRTINLGSSEVVVGYRVEMHSPYVTLNTGTSHIRMTANGAIINSYAGQTYNNITFEGLGAYNSSIQSTGTAVGKEIQYNRVEFRGPIGSISGHNMFNELFLTPGGTYTLSAGGDIQTVKTKLTMSGNPCSILFLKSSLAGTQANFRLMAGRRDFNFVNIKDINATGGLALHFGDKSTVANQNNTNVTYDAYNSGEFNGFGSDWLCHVITANVPASYTLSADQFYGNEYTEYTWRKVNDPKFPNVLGTGTSLSILITGYGTYKLEVKYNDNCIVVATINVVERTAPVVPTETVEICRLPVNTLADVVINGESLKFYATAVSPAVLPLTTALVNGAAYYVTQTKDNCESARVYFTVKLKNCIDVYVNPNLRMRVPFE